VAAEGQRLVDGAACRVVNDEEGVVWIHIRVPGREGAVLGGEDIGRRGAHAAFGNYKVGAAIENVTGRGRSVCCASCGQWNRDGAWLGIAVDIVDGGQPGTVRR